MKRSGLVRYVPLRRTKGINRISAKAKGEWRIWLAIKKERMAALRERFGFVPCEYCKGHTGGGYSLFAPEGHHNDGDRRNNTPENCRILHRYCNQVIEDRNILDVPSLL